ncbi:MAG: cytochrome c biogenesis protein CcsA, partial [Bacteroidia bacterium]
MPNTQITYAGEHIWAGQLGNTFLVLSFVAAFVSLVAYYLSSKDNSYFRMARTAFHVHSFAVLGIAATLFYMLFNHFYEYEYVWHHSNNSMPMRYILSCFWEGQEGSFLLWTFWNVVLGLLLKRTLNGNSWEAPVMTIFSLVQLFLASMLLGIYVIDYKIGSSPFILLRQHPEYMNMPFTQSANYLSKLDGRGLNPLLMNYWMTIHPPTLFLGFASTLPPFAFALAGLWKRQYDRWQQVALPWTFFGILILGVGILMGGAWAYEALSFGGFWAWDPVENSSLVPWLILVGAGHVMIVNKNKGGSLFTTHLMAIGSFLLVLYSTFLTRSGILGESSVHAFTDLGMQGQLVLYVLTFVLLCVAFMIDNALVRVSYMLGSCLLAFFTVLYGYQKIALIVWIACSVWLCVYGYMRYFPKEEEEEELFSREFWIFLGSLLLLLSSLIITYFTSIPVLNKLFNLKKAPLEIRDYNLWIIPFTILISILIGGAQFLKFRRSDRKQFFQKLRLPLLLAVLFGGICSLPLYYIKGFSGTGSLHQWELISYSLLLISAGFAAFANADYWARILKGKIAKAGASIAHIGFALILIGALISTSKKMVLSKNTANKKVESFGKEFNGQVSILLTQGDTLPMGPYLVTYEGRRREGIDVFFKVNYFVKGKDNTPQFAFQLQPKMQENPRMGRAPDPD